MTSTPKIDVVILTWNDGPLLDAAIASTLASEGVDLTITVVDNGSTPPAVVPADARIQIVRNEVNRGVRARNQGVAVGTAPIAVFVDSDVRVLPDTLSRLVAAVEAAPDIALAAPVFVDQTPEASAGRAPGLRRKLARVAGLTSVYGSTRRTAEAVWDVDFSITACVVFRRAAFEAVGGLDERYFYGPEDLDLCLRLKTAGWRVVQVGDARCIHPPRRRNRGLFSRRGLRHAFAVLRHLWRHRHFSPQASR
ncbi:MAG: glycosyltransferase family 2 protein [Actinobacteria bacterium]|nr:glycosyltransferase family 2 protein [Actinomycetota bacterium]